MTNNVIVGRGTCVRRKFARAFFLSFLAAAALAAPLAAQAATTALPSFSPNSIVTTGSANLVLTLSNGDTGSTYAASSTQTLNLPSGLTFTGANSTTCAGLTVNATSGGTALTLSGSGTVPVSPGTCAITAGVTATTVQSYTVTLPANFFTVTDGSKPPGNALSASLSVTAPQAVTVTLSSAYGATIPAVGAKVNVSNSYFSLNAADFPATGVGQTRFRFRLSNPNPFPLNITTLNFPLLSVFNVVPNSLISTSLDTTGASGLTSGAVACGGTLTATDYTLTPPTDTVVGSTTYPPTSATLTGGQIPASGVCEVSFLVRYDQTQLNNGAVSTGNGGASSVTFALPANALTTAEGVGNSTVTLTDGYNVGLAILAQYPNTAPTSGYNGTSTTVQIGTRTSRSSSAMTPQGTGLLWHFDAGIVPDLTQFPLTATVGAACPQLPASAVNGTAATGGQIAITATTPNAANSGNDCLYNVPFISSYSGTGGTTAAYTDAQVCALPDGPDGITSNADDAYVTTAGGIRLKVIGLNGAGTNATNCVTYRAVTATAPDPNAVQVSAQLLNFAGVPITSFPQGGDALMQLTLTAGTAAVDSFSLITNKTTYPLVNGDPSLSYVPAASSTCTSAVVTATPGINYFSVSGVHIDAGQSCTVSVPVTYGNTGGFAPLFSVQTCDAIGTINSSSVCSTGMGLTLGLAGGPFSFQQSFIPATADVATAAAQGTLYHFVLTKAAGYEPVENASANVSLASVSGADFG